MPSKGEADVEPFTGFPSPWAWIDEGAVPVQFCYEPTMKKPAVKPREKKTPGTLAVEKYRPKMNKLTDAERERLLAQAMVTIYGQPANADRR